MSGGSYDYFCWNEPHEAVQPWEYGQVERMIESVETGRAGEELDPEQRAALAAYLQEKRDQFATAHRMARRAITTARGLFKVIEWCDSYDMGPEDVVEYWENKLDENGE